MSFPKTKVVALGCSLHAQPLDGSCRRLSSTGLQAASACSAGVTRGRSQLNSLHVPPAMPEGQAVKQPCTGASPACSADARNCRSNIPPAPCRGESLCTSSRGDCKVAGDTCGADLKHDSSHQACILQGQGREPQFPWNYEMAGWRHLCGARRCRRRTLLHLWGHSEWLCCPLLDHR